MTPQDLYERIKKSKNSAQENAVGLAMLRALEAKEQKK